MATIVAECPRCGRAHELPGSAAGKRLVCRGCGAESRIPRPTSVLFRPVVALRRWFRGLPDVPKVLLIAGLVLTPLAAMWVADLYRLGPAEEPVPRGSPRDPAAHERFRVLLDDAAALYGEDPEILGDGVVGLATDFDRGPDDPGPEAILRDAAASARRAVARGARPRWPSFMSAYRDGRARGLSHVDAIAEIDDREKL